MPKLGFIHSIVFAESIEKTNSTLGTGSSGSKGNELVSELGVEEGRKSGSDAGSGVGITSPLIWHQKFKIEFTLSKDNLSPMTVILV